MVFIGFFEGAVCSKGFAPFVVTQRTFQTVLCDLLFANRLDCLVLLYRKRFEVPVFGRAFSIPFLGFPFVLVFEYFGLAVDISSLDIFVRAFSLASFVLFTICVRAACTLTTA
jgi:hypothetical protein